MSFAVRCPCPVTSWLASACSSASAPAPTSWGLNALRDGIREPNSSQECPYSGLPVSTKGVGICKAGTQVCAADGQSWGSCSGEVDPKPAEDCATPVDDTCCTPPSTAACYDGPTGTEGVGECVGGMKTCLAAGVYGVASLPVARRLIFSH